MVLNADTVMGTVFAEPLDTGVAVGSAKAVEFVAGVVTGADVVVVPEFVVVDAGLPEPPPPQDVSARQAASVNPNHLIDRMLFSLLT